MNYNDKITETKDMLQKRIEQRMQINQAMDENIRAIAYLEGRLQALEEFQKEHDTNPAEIVE